MIYGNMDQEDQKATPSNKVCFPIRQHRCSLKTSRGIISLQEKKTKTEKKYIYFG